jgi:hypothetical protein
MFLVVERDRCVMLEISPLSMSRFSRQYDIISQPYGPSRTVTRIAILLYMLVMFEPHRKHTYWPPRAVTVIALLLIYNVRISQETRMGLHGLLRR